ncbi:MAG: ATP-binding protein, partial [Burkholderiaceae bacterium]
LNRAWFELVGTDHEAPLGFSWMEALHPEDREDVAAVWLRARATGLPFSGIRRIRGKDGTYHTMAYRGAPVPRPDGSVDFWVGIDADISELKAIEDALRRSNQELEAFSYSVSHDLRAPLSTIDGFSRLLARQLEGAAAEKASHYLLRIQTAAAQMGQLIEALLSLAQVSRAKLRHEPVDVGQMAREIFAVLRVRDPAREVDTVIGEDVVAPGDPRLVRVLMENLLGNAWKFTAKEPHARIEVGRSGNEIYVRDNGVGFDMVYADKLFAAFQRLHSADEFPGTGIGLATVGRVVARHGGTIRAEAEPGEGAAFYFCLPDTPPPPRPGEAG